MKKTVKRTPTKRRRAAVGKRTTVKRRRKTSSMGSANITGILTMVGGAVISRVADPMLKNVISNDMLRRGLKAGLGVFAATRGGMIGNLGAGIAIESGAALVGGFLPGSMGYVSDEIGSTNDPVLIGYEAGEMFGDEFGALPALISGDEFGEDDLSQDEFGEDDLSADEFGEDDLGVDEFGEDDLSADEFGYSPDELQGLI
jgi:hypothetical protein